MDVRPRSAYETEHYSDAIHFDTADTEFNNLKPYRLKRCIILIGEGMDDARAVANRLVEKHFPFVCMLHGGMGVLRADYNDKLVRKR